MKWFSPWTYLNTDQMTGILRAVLPSLLAYAVWKHWLPPEYVADLSVVIVTVAAAIWSILSNKTGKVIA